MASNVSIFKATPTDIKNLTELDPKSDEGFFEDCFKRQCEIFIIQKGTIKAGYAVLNWEPKYALYKRLEYPEIQDLNILPKFQQQGLATKLIQYLENQVVQTGKAGIGISVGLNKDFGAAQRLYAKLGYIPDGMGATYDRVYVEMDQRYFIDDDLCLMLVKEF